jgi:hypothetical protein
MKHKYKIGDSVRPKVANLLMDSAIEWTGVVVKVYKDKHNETVYLVETLNGLQLTSTYKQLLYVGKRELYDFLQIFYKKRRKRK